MKITLFTVGKMKEKYLQQGMQEYIKRLSAFAKVDVIEVTDEKTAEQMSVKEIQLVKEKEGERLLKKIPQQTYLFALAIEGKPIGSQDLAAHLDQLFTQGHSQIGFVIGGSLGLSDEVLARAQQTLSFSSLTFPHPLMRLILIEQIYRTFKINRGEPYHK